MLEAIKNIAAQANSIDAKYAANHEWFDSITDIYEDLDAPDGPDGHKRRQWCQTPWDVSINPISEGLAYPAIDILADESPMGHSNSHAALLAALGL